MAAASVMGGKTWQETWKQGEAQTKELEKRMADELGFKTKLIRHCHSAPRFYDRARYLADSGKPKRAVNSLNCGNARTSSKIGWTCR